MNNSKIIFKYTIVNKLHCYNWNNKEIERVKNNISERVYKKDIFIKKYKDFMIENNKLIFKPLMLEVNPNNKRNEIITNFYNDCKAIGSGKTKQESCLQVW